MKTIRKIKVSHAGKTRTVHVFKAPEHDERYPFHIEIDGALWNSYKTKASALHDCASVVESRFVKDTRDIITAQFEAAGFFTEKE